MNKKLLTVAVAGALTAATAVPALALENEFHGAFSAYYDLSNYSAIGNDGGEQFDPRLPANDPDQPRQNATGLSANSKTENYFVQRARINYTAKANDNAKLVTKFELDYRFYGNNSYDTGRNRGGALGADTVQIETKNVYLDLSYPALNTKIGMQSYNDSFKGVLFDADMAGILFSHDYKNAGVSAGFFRFGDNGPTLGLNAYDMIAVDGKYSISKDVKVGAAYYYIGDNRISGEAVPANGSNVHSVGVNAEGLVGPLALNGFALFQFGNINPSQGTNIPLNVYDTHTAHGYAFNLGAKLPVLGGTARSEFLYVSGGSDAFYNPVSAGGSEGGGFYDAEMIMLNRDKNAKSIDQAIVYDANNYNQGLIMGSVGFDYPFNERLTASANAGFAAVAHNDGRSNPNGTSDYLGTEINAECNYKLNANTTIGIRGGYVFLGDYFKGVDGGKDADNIYDMKVLAAYAF